MREAPAMLLGPVDTVRGRGDQFWVTVGGSETSPNPQENLAGFMELFTFWLLDSPGDLGAGARAFPLPVRNRWIISGLRKHIRLVRVWQKACAQ